MRLLDEAAGICIMEVFFELFFFNNSMFYSVGERIKEKSNRVSYVLAFLFKSFMQN